MFQDATIVISSWAITSLLQLITAPFLYFLFRKKLADGGWAFGRLAGWLVISLIVWFRAHLGIPFNQNIFLCLLVGLAALASSYLAVNHWSQIRKYFRKFLTLILIEESLFLLGFLFLAFIRAHNPAILDLEKFMDAGFIQAYLRSPTLPAEDMWLAGEKINYYTFGHFMGSIMIRLWGLKIEYGYNLLLSLLMGLSLSQAFSIGVSLVKPLFKSKNKKSINSIRSGLIAAFLVIIGGNSHSTWYLLKNQTFKAYWYPDATRFIERTIHEFPAYSFIVSDLHAHVWGLPLVLFLIINVWIWLQAIVHEVDQEIIQPKDLLQLKHLRRAIFLGLLFGIMIMTSTWDFMIYGVFMAVLSIALLLQNPKIWLHLILSGITVIILALFTALPWLLNFVSISEGIRIATEHSPFWQLLVLWGGHVLFNLIALYFASRLIKIDKFRNRSTYLIVISFVLTALFLITLPELIYFKDIYPNHPRANTMFKLTFQAFVMMGIAISWLSGVLNLEKFNQNLKVSLRFLLGLFIVAVGLYPYFGYRDYYSRLKNYQGLNGLEWMKQQLPDDYYLVQWMRENIDGRPVILEAPGDSYTKYSRISAFTGMPSVVGWKVHEWLWRGGYDVPQGRTAEVELVYRSPGSDQARKILEKYRVKYIVVSSLEREKYPDLDENQLKQLGEFVYEINNSQLIKL